MARHESIVNNIWDELDSLSNDAVLLYIWSWTNPACGMAGIYRIGRRKLLDGRLTDEALTAALAELEADGKLFYVDGVLWVKARVKRIRSRNRFVGKAIENDLREIDPGNPLLAQFLDLYEQEPFLEGLETVRRPSRDRLGLGSTEPDQRPSPEGLETLLDTDLDMDTGHRPGHGPGLTATATEWESWLEHYRAETGRDQVRGSRAAHEQFNARRKEGIGLDDLKLATVGCHGDEWCRERGFDVPETILRASNVTRYIELGRNPRKQPGPNDAFDREMARLEAERIRLKREEQQQHGAI